MAWLRGDGDISNILYEGGNGDWRDKSGIKKPGVILNPRSIRF